MLDIYTYRCIGNIKLDIYIAIIQQKTPSHNKREGNENGTSDIHVRPVRRNGSRKYPTFGPSMGNRSRSGIVPGYFWTELVCVVRSIDRHKRRPLWSEGVRPPTARSPSWHGSNTTTISSVPPIDSLPRSDHGDSACRTVF